MFYIFPKITNINDVLPFVKDRSDFIVAVKDRYTVINYAISSHETFGIGSPNTLENTILRECRGLLFCNETGEILSRPYHKFFNIGENHEVAVENVRFDKEHMLMEKLDGSMIRPIVFHGGIVRLGSKMGITDTSMDAEEWLMEQSNFADWFNFFRTCAEYGRTPIFEWVSPNNRIVLGYDEPKLILTALRDTTLGSYYDIHNNGFIPDFIERVKVFDPINPEDLEAFLESSRTKTDEEGVVVRFSNGHMLKRKTDWYVNLHRVKSDVNANRKIVKVILEEGIDDMIAALAIDPETQKIVLDKTVVFHRAMQYLINKVLAERDSCVMNHGNDRKAIALSIAKNPLKSLIFKCLDGKPVVEIVTELGLKSVGSVKNFNNFCDVIGLQELKD